MVVALVCSHSSVAVNSDSLKPLGSSAPRPLKPINSRFSSAPSCCKAAPKSLKIDVAAPGVPDLFSALARIAVSRKAARFIFKVVTFSRTAASLMRPLSSPMYCLAIAAKVGPLWAGRAPPLKPPIPERSNCNSRLPTVQPLFSSPTRLSLLAIALSKNVSQKGEEPEIKRIGFTVTPG